MTPTFGEFTTGSGAELQCPQCGSYALHHDRVEIFEREEDAIHGVHMTVEDGKATVDTALAGNPSARRHGLKIRFWCEGCNEKPLFSLMQHKGMTYVNFE